MATIHGLLVQLHIAVGAVALILFWVPAATRKGSRLHVRAGRWYTYAMYAVCASALAASLLVLFDPLAVRQAGATFEAAEAERIAGLYRMFSLFLLMLSVLVFGSVRHGLAALRERRFAGALRTPGHRATILLLGLVAIPVGITGYANGQWLLVIFGVISLNAAYRMWRDLRIERPSRSELVVMHLRGLIGSGVGAYTAFFAFGGDRLLGGVLTGQWRIVPWILPAIVGSVVLQFLDRRYGRPSARKAA